MSDLDKIFKAYDVRGVVPDELDESVAEAVGAAFVRLTGAKTIVTLHDMRASSGPLADAIGRGATSQGADVISGGLGSTDMVYYAAGSLDIPGAMVTASHNPASYNGIKLCKAGAKPVGIETGLAEIKAMVARRRPRLRRRAGHHHRAGTCCRATPSTSRSWSTSPASARSRSSSTRATAWAATPCRPCSRGCRSPSSRSTSSSTARSPTTRRTRSTRRTCATCSGRSRSTRPTSASPSTATPTAASSSTSGARSSRPSVLAALIATRELAREPGAAVIHNLITSRAVPELVTEHGGTPVRTRVGHSFIKAKMSETQRHLRRRALGPLLLQGLLVRGLGHAGRAARAGRARPRRPPAVGHPQRVLPLRRQRRDQQRGLRPGRRDGEDQEHLLRTVRGYPRRAGRSHRRAGTRGGSTSVRPTPSRCCGSTSKRRAKRKWPPSATRYSA